MLDKVKDYKLISLIGKGAYATVYRAKKITSGEYFAIKLFNALNETPDDLLTVTNEINILSLMNCDNIVKLYEHFIDIRPLGDKYYCIVMELCENGDLGILIQHKLKERSWFSEEEVIKIMIQICKGLDYLHRNKIIHRDLKSMNILINNKNIVKIGDFGVSKVLNNGFAKTFVGTPYYLSPEICQEKAYNEKTDIWSLGCVLYEMLTLNKPFVSNNQMGLLMKIIKGIPSPISNEVRNRYSDWLFQLMNKMLEKNANKRTNIKYILDIFCSKANKDKEESHSTDIIKPIEAISNRPLAYVKKKSNKEVIPKRVRQPPKNKTIPYNEPNKLNPSKQTTHQLVILIVINSQDNQGLHLRIKK